MIKYPRLTIAFGMVTGCVLFFALVHQEQYKAKMEAKCFVANGTFAKFGKHVVCKDDKGGIIFNAVYRLF